MFSGLSNFIFGKSSSQVEAEKLAAALQAEKIAKEREAAENRRRELLADDEKKRQKEEYEAKLETEKVKKREMEEKIKIANQQRKDDERKQELLRQKEKELHEREMARKAQEMQELQISMQKEAERKAQEERRKALEDREHSDKQHKDQLTFISQQMETQMKRSDEMHKQNVEILNKQVEQNQIANGKLMETLTTLVSQFNESRTNFEKYVGQKPEKDIDPPEDLKETVYKARRELGLDTANYFNFAFVGHTKVGKSSLINAIRGMYDEEEGAAAVGITETTHKITSYASQDPKLKHVRIYDIPGAGTLTHDAGSYYEDKCLCAFDCLIIVAQTTLGQEEVEFALKSLKYGQPIAIVRSRCDIELDNKKKMRKIKTVDQHAVYDFINEVSPHYIAELKKAKNSDLQRVPIFFISAVSLRDLMRCDEPELIFQEKQFLEYITLQSKFARNIIT